MFKGSLCFGLSLSVAIGLGAGESDALDRAYESSRVRRANEPAISDPVGSASAIQAAATFATQEPATLAIPLANGKNLKLQRVSVTTSENGTTWGGIVEDTEESAILMRWNDGRVGGVLGYKGQVYAITSEEGQLHAVIERQPKNVRDRAVTSPQHTADAFRRHTHTGDASAAAFPHVAPFSDAERLTLEAKQITIDLMVVYTKSAASRYVMPMKDLIARMVEETNQSFRNSGLANISLRLIYTQLFD
jgi:hypothetical protein